MKLSKGIASVVRMKNVYKTMDARQRIVSNGPWTADLWEQRKCGTEMSCGAIIMPNT